MSKDSVNHVVNDSGFTFCFSIFGRSMQATELENKTIIITKPLKQGIVIFTPVITY